MLRYLAQRLNHICPAGIATLWAFGERPGKNNVNLTWQVRLHTGRRGRRELSVRHDQLRGRTRKGHSPGDDLVSHDPQRVEIATPIHPAGLSLLRRNILRCAHKHAGAGKSFTIRIRRLGDAKVRQHHPTAHIQHHVMGLHIAMDRTLAMGEVQGAGHRVENAHRIAESQVRIFVEDTMQGTTINKLHGDEV